MEILFFGQLADITGTSVMLLSGFPNMSALQEELHRQYPALADHQYRVAVGNCIVEGDQNLAETDKIAFLPPFSGG